MSDAALRAAERAFAADPTDEREAALLRARLRAGRLSRARVYVAAWLRHPPALAALGDEAPPDERPAGPAVTAAFEALDDAARRALVVVALDSLDPTPPGSVAAHCVAALRAWVEDGRPIPPAVLEASAQQARRERRDPYDPRHRLVRIVGTGRGWGGLLLWFRLETPLRRPAARALLGLAGPAGPAPPRPPGAPRGASAARRPTPPGRPQDRGPGEVHRVAALRRARVGPAARRPADVDRRARRW